MSDGERIGILPFFLVAIELEHTKLRVPSCKFFAPVAKSRFGDDDQVGAGDAFEMMQERKHAD